MYNCSALFITMRNKIITLVYLILVAFAFAFLNQRLSFYEEEVEHVFDKEAQLVIWEFQAIEAGVRELLNTVNSLTTSVSCQELSQRIDFASLAFVHFIKGYGMLSGMKGLSKDSIMLKVVELGDDLFLRQIYDLNKGTIVSEKFKLNENGEYKFSERWQSDDIEIEDAEWLKSDDYRIDDTVFTEFYKSSVTKKEIFTATGQMFDKKGGLLSVDISLNYLASKLKRLKQDGSYYIICDQYDNIRLMAARYNETFDLKSSKSLSVDKTEVNEFLKETHEKNYFPEKYISFKVNGSNFVGKWEYFDLGKKEYKLGHVVRHDVRLYWIWLIFSFVAIIIPPAFIYFFRFNKIGSKINVNLNPSITKEVLEEDLILLADIQEKIDAILTKEKLYLDPNCSVGLISDKLVIDRVEISKAIYTQKDRTVKEYINDYRISDVEAFMKNDKDVANISIDHIAEKFGYRSRTSFHREFKKRTNYSPAEYIALNSTSRKNV